MNNTYILFNPLAGNGKCKEEAQKLKEKHPSAIFTDMSAVKDYFTFFKTLDESDNIIICGGDGTLNRFVNDTDGIEIKNRIYYYAVGSGNDFVRDLNKEKGAEPTFLINKYLKDLPSVTVNGTKRLFINGVGYGIDGYCCEVGDKLRAENEITKKDKPINYTAIAIKGLLFHFKPANAVITVDGKEYKFKRVWIAPCMNGKYYGGGMMPAPAQDRLNEERKLTLSVIHTSGKLHTLMIFPSIFKGTHTEHKKQVTLLSGNEITVRFDRPTPLQIDGETILDVTSYTARSVNATEQAQKTLTAV